ncbi:hypothetical protein TIFTF001_013721 [Ficus carica]|uniref:UDP-N-acetylmuramate--L-alanine ligase n=1 Tax=Ficus carica TaxID=3494 RepID=A0AA88D374_FICCA|nr:hypothetical protein TIFTF001_013721 [Ficus carica]
MEFPAISPSKSLNFPANILGKCKTQPHIILRKKYFRCEPHYSLNSTAAFNDDNGSSSISKACTDEKVPESASSINQKEWLHFVGVGGCGMSALAILALKQGYEVSGSDLVWSSFMDRLQEAGARLHIGHSASNLRRRNGSRLPNAVVISSAIPHDNVEILNAKFVGVPVYKRDYWLGNLTRNHKLIAVSGSHGKDMNSYYLVLCWKSTTTAMLAYVLNAMDDDLTAIVGAEVPQFTDGNVISGSSETFVLEADEYDNCFLKLAPYIAVVTNLDWEHVDVFPNEEAVKNTFRAFLNRIRKDGHLILCGDSKGACSLLNHCKQAAGSDALKGAMSVRSSKQVGNCYKITTFGLASSNEWHASLIRPNSEGGSDYTLCHLGCPVADISLQIPGIHNVLNSLAVIAVAMALVGNERQVYETVNDLRLQLKNFKGISRRFEIIGSIGGCHIVDDYAHHPTEIRAVLQAARQHFPSKALWVVFQPHTYSRLAALKDDFAIALSNADQVVITRVYASRETDNWNVSGNELSASITGPPSEYIPSLDDVVDKLVLQILEDPHRDIVVLTLGAGEDWRQ